MSVNRDESEGIAQYHTKAIDMYRVINSFLSLQQFYFSMKFVYNGDLFSLFNGVYK